MTLDLILGDAAHSSWSLRAWAIVDRLQLPVTTRFLRFAEGPVADQLAAHAPARTVPLLMADGLPIGDSLAIAEELASRFPTHPVWPADPGARAMARWLAAEMHSGFATLRNECPMHLLRAYEPMPVSDPLAADLARIEALWQAAHDRFGGLGGAAGPWLLGEWSAADAFYAPVAARIATYDLPVGALARAYVGTHLGDPSFRRWRAIALADAAPLPRYEMDRPHRPWPGPAPRAAERAQGPGLNERCPYSGRVPTAFLSLGGQVWGFCNPHCRDKTLADPEAWPSFTTMVTQVNASSTPVT